MAPRPTWQGHLKLSLVTCPVGLYTATDAGAGVSFNLINPKTKNRIKMVTTDPDTGPIERSELVKGYQIEKGQYVLFTDEEIKSVQVESNKTIDIERFVPEAEIDRLYWDNPYFLAPEGKMAQEPFAVIREAMVQSKQIALGKVVLSNRERLVALEPRGKGILAYTLRTNDEVRKADDVFSDISDEKPSAEMIALAKKIIETKEGEFDPSTFVDRYDEALRAMIVQKSKGKKVAAPKAAPDRSNVIDLMAALKASVAKDRAKAAAPAVKAVAAPKAKARARR
ncbi:MAG: Ku protein [Alphaproteobacteria bacterium]|nr:Ku protein [Alphaproteobacteria bacterium]